MPAFGERSTRCLATCHPDLQLIFNTVIEWYDCAVICGHRNKAAQDKVFADGMSQVQWPDSMHNMVPSMAADVLPYPINWKYTEEMTHLAGMVQGVARMLYARGDITHLVRWGGDFDKDNDLHDSSWDKPHYELYKPKQGE
jgi:peptidoglycan L-alanyl-D-glutamate endopeptidase CwlK